MIYSLEYLNEDADIEILRYDTATKQHQTVISAGHAGGYKEPTNEEIYLCYDVGENENFASGLVGKWSQKVGSFKPQYKENDSSDYESIPAYSFIREVIENDHVSLFMEQLLGDLKKTGNIKEDGTIADMNKDNSSFRSEVKGL